MKKKRIVIALGGNAIQNKGEKGTYQESFQNVYNTMQSILPLLTNPEYEVVITHGNGPQVGTIMIQNAKAADIVPEMPMFMCGAMSQGQIGYWIQQSLNNLLGTSKEVATVVTQVEVDENSQAFKNPTKPVGSFYTEAQIADLKKTNDFIYKEDAGRGWRRVVPSPDPINIVEINTIRKLVDDGVVVIASGGGGIPVINVANKYSGVDAVIDKDKAGALLAELLNADMLIILTAVDQVAINFGKENQENLSRVNVMELQNYLSEGHFAEGSMKPKVEAVISYLLKAPTKEALITSPDKLTAALAHQNGTYIIN
jgi:carbamate kinase